jgi:sterol desaturase/sphingolipid hydroxylase (fatty acid hydroxylase superfamily)
MQPFSLVLAFVLLGVGFGLVEWRWPSIRGQRRLRKGVLTDLIYFAFSPTLGKLFTAVFVFFVLAVPAMLFSVPAPAQELRHMAQPDTAISRQPVALQLIEFLILADFIGYWSHRAFHRVSRLWRIHAVHHSSTEVDWLSSVRVHPLNDAISTAVIATPLLVLGFDRLAIATYVPFITLYAIGLHANVSWDYGPLRRVIASPRFHRWHHSSEPAARDRNFAGLFVLWDQLFGTFYLPKERPATAFGVSGEAVPDGFLGQFFYPFRRPRPDPNLLQPV